MITSLTISHRFAAAHRLPHLARSQCANLHGHNWDVKVTIAGRVGESALLVDFDQVKNPLREWVDTNLDHRTLLGADDELRPVLAAYRQPLFIFGPGGDWERLRWPTVEAVTLLIAEQARHLLAPTLDLVGAYVQQVTVEETPGSSATWQAGLPGAGATRDG